MKKKLTSLLLVLVMIASMIPSAFAAAGFFDVEEDDWFYTSVKYAVEHNLMAGVGDDLFAPNDPMTRAMAVTVLYNMAGKPAPSSGNPFADVPAGSWFANPCVWAAENGITSGVSANSFGPNQFITREQLVVFLYKYAKTTDLELTYAPNLLGFKDRSYVSDWAEEAMRWSILNDIVCGDEDNLLLPQFYASRAACATVLMRFNELMTGAVPPKQPEPETEPTVPETEPTVPETEPTEPEMDIEALNDPAHLEAIAQAAIKHINIMRKEEGNAPLDCLPGMQEVAMYRAVQLTTNFAHDPNDIHEAHNIYKYGEIADNAGNYESKASESILHGDFGHPDDVDYQSMGFIDYIDYAGWLIADTNHNSEGHWHSVGSELVSVTGVGIHFGEDGELFCCVMVAGEECRKYG